MECPDCDAPNMREGRFFFTCDRCGKKVYKLKEKEDD